MEAIETLEVEEATIHDVESAMLRQQLVKDVDVVHLAITSCRSTPKASWVHNRRAMPIRLWAKSA
jgi:hypothetical protein